MTPLPPRVHSALFVPGQRQDFLAKVDDLDLDCVIIDLEDSVTSSAKTEARATSGQWIASRPDATSPVIVVRINPLEDGQIDLDLAAVVHANLTAVMVPKIEAPGDVLAVVEALSYAEGRAGVPRGSVRIWPLVETASAVQQCDAIARSSERVAYMGGGTSAQGDLARSLGFEWTSEGMESHYVRSKVLVDVKAAGVPNPMTGLVAAIPDLDAVRTFAESSRRLGYAGMMAIHPSHLPIINETFRPTQAQIDEAHQILDALAQGERDGVGAVTLNGTMLDAAMAKVAHIVLDNAVPTHQPTSTNGS